MIDELTKISTATLQATSTQVSVLPRDINPIDPDSRISGRIFTVRLDPASNYYLHKAIYEAGKSDILVVQSQGNFELGYFGEIMTVAAKQRQLKGLVIDSCVRDTREIIDLGFPVFCKGISIKNTTKEKLTSQTLPVPIEIGSCNLRPGDIIVGDPEGLVSFPERLLKKVIHQALANIESEKEWIAQIRQGRSTMDLLKLV
ncbi:MAG TPA: RraA family protein [Eudoraea sp.]|nr:RraA family protein [Eudoraea sp.]